MYELTKDLSGLPEGICRLGNMLEFHGECMAVSTIHHTIRWKQWTIFSTNMHASMLKPSMHGLMHHFPTGFALI